MASHQTKYWFVVAISTVFFLGCSKPASKKTPILRTVVACKTDSPTESEITIRPGDTLVSISQLRFGSQHYYKVLMLYNHLETERELVVGTQLRTPNLRQALMEEIGESIYQPAIEWLACAQIKYRKEEVQLSQLAGRSQQHPVDMPDDVVHRLMDVSKDLDAAVANLEQLTGSEKTVPSRAIGQLGEAAGLIATLAKGEFDSYGYDRDMVNQRLALAMTYLILWARSGYK
jgi:hypothetical protein